jgi:hypothetical protein
MPLFDYHRQNISAEFNDFSFIIYGSERQFSLLLGGSKASSAWNRRREGPRGPFSLARSSFYRPEELNETKS